MEAQRADSHIGGPPPELEAWRRFRELVDRSEGARVEALRFDELRELARLYRLHGAALARAR
ncbi:MAG: hypothetical protein R3263_07830 [Myxococcota bacterium]|nr:hypothetical protein [Myxococcota bacterium]